MVGSGFSVLPDFTNFLVIAVRYILSYKFSFLHTYPCPVFDFCNKPIINFFVVRLANDSKGKGGERQFNGLVDVYVKTIKSDGIQGLYRGFVISAVGIFIYRYLQTTIFINLPFGESA
jgi:hypothetical protein